MTVEFCHLPAKISQSLVTRIGPMNKIRVLLADEHDAILTQVRFILGDDSYVNEGKAGQRYP